MLPELFDQVFKDEYYSVVSSPQKVYQALKRLRNFLRESHTGLDISEFNGTYRLQARKGKRATLVFSHGTSAIPSKVDHIKLTRQLKILNHSFYNREFSNSDAARILRISKRAANYVLQHHLEGRHITRVGQGPRTTYQFCASLISRA